MVITAISIIGTLAGVLVGFVLSEVSATHRNKNRSDRLRTLAKLEVQQNLHSLKNFWEKFQAESIDFKGQIIGEDFHDTLEILAQKYVNTFSKIPFPEWNRKVWQSKFSSLSAVLSEDEIMQVWEMFNELDKVSEFRETFTAYRAEADRQIFEAAVGEKDPVFWGIISAFSNDSRFLENVLELWMECEQTISGIIKRGNPIL